MSKRLGLILMGALAVRLVGLGQSLWLDEAIQWWAVKSFNLKQLLTGYMVGDFNPPGYQLLMWFWVKIFGDSEVALRMPSVLFGVGTVWLVYKISEIINKKSSISLCASLIVAVNGLLIWYSQEARMYAMAAFLVTGAVYCFLKKEELGRLGYLSYLGLMTGALYSHYLAWLMLPFLLIWGAKWLLPLVLTIPWWPVLMRQLRAGLSVAGNPVWAGISETNLKNLELVPVKFVTGRVPWPVIWQGQVLTGIAVVLFWIIAGIGVIGVAREIRGIKDRRMILIYWAFGPLVLGALIGLIMPVFLYFRFLFSLPAVILLATMGAEKLGKLGKLGLLGTLGVFSLIYIFNSNFHRENWRGAVAELHDQGENQEVLIHPAVRPPFDYYDQGKSFVIFLDQLPIIPTESRILDKSIGTNYKLQNVLWYIPYAQPIFNPDDGVRVKLTESGYQRVFERHFRGVTLEKWSNAEALARNE